MLVASGDGLTVAHKLVKDVLMLSLLERTSHGQLGKDFWILAAFLGAKHPQRLVYSVCGIGRQRDTSRCRIHKLLLLLSLLKLG